MGLENIDGDITIFYAVGNSLIKGDFYHILEDSFYARIIQKLPYIDINGNFNMCDITYTIFLGTYLDRTNEIQVLNFNNGKPYTLRFYKQDNDIVCDNKEDFKNTILNFKVKYEELHEHILNKKKICLRLN